MGRDLRVWVRRLPESREWLPNTSSSASVSRTRDAIRGATAESRHDPTNRFLLRGSVDVIEQSVNGATLRVTDHKTGRDRSSPRTVIGGGNILQPVL